MKRRSLLLGTVMLVLLLGTEWIALPVPAMLAITLAPALIVAGFAQYEAGRRRRRWYADRQVLYREWLARYDESRRSDISRFLRAYAAAFGIPRSILHKIGPDDRVLDYHRRNHGLSQADPMEDASFARQLKAEFGYEVAPSDTDSPLGVLFEKVTRGPASH